MEEGKKLTPRNPRELGRKEYLVRLSNDGRELEAFLERENLGNVTIQREIRPARSGLTVNWLQVVIYTAAVYIISAVVERL